MPRPVYHVCIDLINEIDVLFIKILICGLTLNLMAKSQYESQLPSITNHRE